MHDNSMKTEILKDSYRLESCGDYSDNEQLKDMLGTELGYIYIPKKT